MAAPQPLQRKGMGMFHVKVSGDVRQGNGRERSTAMVTQG
jgi:hypothetical protein